MRILGAILAGGASRRFGRDKALALIDGKPMLDHVAARLAPQCEALVIAGRDWPGMIRVDDRPLPGLGPLGGIAGALLYARQQRFDAVLTSGCDLPDLPRNLIERLGAPGAIAAGQPTIGLWDVRHSDGITNYLAKAGDRSIRGWANMVGARRVTLDATTPNINTPADLVEFSRRREGPRSSR